MSAVGAPAAVERLRIRRYGSTASRLTAAIRPPPSMPVTLGVLLPDPALVPSERIATGSGGTSDGAMRCEDDSNLALTQLDQK
jgi:hypothetical protein